MNTFEENNNLSEQEEVVNPEQFQVGRTPHHEQEEQNEAGYTEEEVTFADGEGTQLEAAFEEGGPENEDEDEDEDEDPEYEIGTSEDDDADFDNPDDDPA